MKGPLFISCLNFTSVRIDPLFTSIFPMYDFILHVYDPSQQSHNLKTRRGCKFSGLFLNSGFEADFP